MSWTRRELLVGRLRRALAAPEVPALRGLRRGVALTAAPAPPPAEPPGAQAPDPEESTPPWLIDRRSRS